MKIGIFLVLIALGANRVQAQSNMTTTNLNQTMGRSNTKPWTLEFLMASQQTRNFQTNEIDGQFTNLGMSLLQGVGKDTELRYYLAARYISNDNTPEDNEFDWWFTEFMYRRRNVFTEEKHGVRMDFEFKNLYYTDPEIREDYGQNGSTIPQIILNKKAGKYGSFQMRLRRHFNHVNGDASDYTTANENRVYLSYAQYIPHGKLFFFQAKYQHKFRRGTAPDPRFTGVAYENGRFNPMTRAFEPDFTGLPIANEIQEFVTIHPSMMIFLNRQNMVEIFYETQVSNTYDKRDVETIMREESVLGVAFYLTAF